VITLVVAGMAAAAETALTSVNRIRIRNQADDGDKASKRIERLLHKPQLFITTILVVSNLAVITASTLATLIAVDLDFNGAEIISTIVLSLTVLIFCEITPKSAAVRAPEAWSRALVGLVDGLMRIMLPLITLLTVISNGLMRLFGAKPGAKTPFVTEDELRLMVEVSEEEGVVEEEEREMIDNIFELNDTTVREVMVPRIDIVAIEADATVAEATRVVLQGGQSRVPVYEDTLDEVGGLLYAKDLLRAMAAGQSSRPVRELVRKPYFVPETKRLDDLLRELKKQRVHMAIVVDEYGGVAGLVTIEDLVEEIIGDIKDEYDIEEQLFERLSENEFLIDAKISVYEFGELVGRELPEGDYDTLGGFVYAQLDKIPTIGDVINFEDLTITVLDTKGRRVRKVKVVRHEPHGPEDEVTEAAAAADETQRAGSNPPANGSNEGATNGAPANGAASNGTKASGTGKTGARERNGRTTSADRIPSRPPSGK
jgi:CBS domain containing-hemolysin-like protein